jgi:hypothetical protein
MIDAHTYACMHAHTYLSIHILTRSSNISLISHAYMPSSLLNQLHAITYSHAVLTSQSNAITDSHAVLTSQPIAAAAAGNQQVVVSFAAPSHTGASPLVRYTVTSEPGGVVGVGTTSPVAVVGLVNGYVAARCFVFLFCVYFVTTSSRLSHF